MNVEGFKFVKMKACAQFQGQIIKNNFCLIRKAETCLEESPSNVDVSLFKLWPSGVEWGHNGDLNFTWELIEISFKSQNHLARETEICVEAQ